MSMSAASGNEFTIRVTGAAPPPLPAAAKKGKKGGGGRGKAAKNNAAQQQQRRYNLRLRPSSSLHQFRNDVFALFNVPSGSTKSYSISFLGGYPPKELNQAGKSTVHELGIRPNESVIVKFSLSGVSAVVEADDGDRKQPVAGIGNTSTEAAASAASTGRPKRASAMAATANFADVIAAQDAILQKDKKSPKKKGSSAGNIAGLGNVNKRIVPYNVASNSKKPKKVKMEGAGYRLSDGKSFAGSSPSKKRSGGKHSQEAMFKSEDDVASKLLSSFGGGGGSAGGNVGKYLRSAMKGAVAKSYEASRAAVRVTAVNSGGYIFEKVKGGSVVEAGGVVLGTAKDYEPKGEEADKDDEDIGKTLYTITYSKGMEGRGTYDEQVEIIGLDALKSVLSSVYNIPDETGGEGNNDGRLRPVLIAQLSPRAFWSLVYHCSEVANRDLNESSQLTVEDMLRTTLPDLDWSHLDRGGRKRVLSEKARENLRQERGEIGQPHASENVSGDVGGTEAIEELEESIMDSAATNGNDDTDLTERERRAKAAMARFGNANNQATLPTSPQATHENTEASDDWSLVTPSEDDMDELIECIMECASSEEEGSTDGNYDETAAKSWASDLLGGVRNWRELANQTPELILSRLTEKSSNLPSRGIIERWIDAAQAHSLDEIMLEILDGDQDALELLQDKARSSSPKDLMLWKNAPVMLLDAISSTEGSSKKFEKSDVMKWIHRAEIALGSCAWLDLYMT